MARSVVLGRRFSPFSALEEINPLQECYCSTFLPGKNEGLPQYLASSYLQGDVRLHETCALTMSEADGISASHFCSFTPCSASVVQLKAMLTDSDMLLMCLDRQGGHCAVRLNDTLTQRGDTNQDTQPQKCFQLPEHETGARTMCFTLDDVHKRIFAGRNDGVWLHYDIETCDFGHYLMQPQSYQAHRSSILDGDYSQGLLASASQDGSVCVWDVRSRSCVAAFDPATGNHLSLSQTKRAADSSRAPCLSVRFDKSGRHVVAASQKKRITVWNIRSDSAQCILHTDCSPRIVDTAKDAVFFSSYTEHVWRYSIYNAQMHCFSTSVPSIQHIQIEREHEETMVVSGEGDTVELLSLNGVSLGKAVGKKEIAEQDFTFSPAATENPWSPTLFDFEGRHPEGNTPQYSPTMEEMCESGSELTEDDDEDVYDQESQAYSPPNSAISFVSANEIQTDDEDHQTADEVLGMGVMEVDGEPLEDYGFTSDSDISPRYDYVIPLIPEPSNCDFSSSQSDEVLSDEEEEE